MTGGERAVHDDWLDLYRETVVLKIAELDAEQLVRRAVPPSSMSLIGIVRHLTEVEAYWLRVVLLDAAASTRKGHAVSLIRDDAHGPDLQFWWS